MNPLHGRRFVLRCCLGRGILSTVPGGDAILSTVEARQRLFGSLVSPTEPWDLTAASLLGLAPPVPSLAAARGRRRVTSVVRQRFTGSVTRSSEATRRASSCIYRTLVLIFSSAV